MAVKKKPDVVVAVATFQCAVEDGDGEHLVHAGDRYAADHPLVKGREALFAPVEPRPDVE
jgi:hypothetical protein